jgi:hypothetical protein
MIEEKDFAKNFNGLHAPVELVKLLKFQNEVSKTRFYSSGFELNVDIGKIGLKTYSEDEVFLSSLFDFALADGTGSTYGFWLRTENMNLSESPIIAFGSEGGFHVVAENIRELLQILTFDSEPMIDWDEISFYKDAENHTQSDYSEVYRNWLNEALNLKPIENPNLLVKKAQDKYQTEFYKWFRQYYKW